MPKTRISFIGLLILVKAAGAVGQNVNARQRLVDDDADRVLQQMSAYLAAATQFSFTAHDMVDEVMPTGQKIQLSTTRHVIVRRPDRVFIDLIGDVDREQIWYDGEQLAVHDMKRNQYSSVAMPDTIDATLDRLNQQYQMTLPLADLLFSDVYAAVSPGVRYGTYLGVHHAQGVRCHHLAFQQEGLDWQIWIEEGAQPVPRKLVITYKEFPGHPQYVALINDWNMARAAGEQQFRFSPPAGTEQVDFSGRSRSPARPPAGPGRAPANPGPRP